MKSGRELKIATRRAAFDPAMSGYSFPQELLCSGDRSRVVSL
jgi:hypothetical protein